MKFSICYKHKILTKKKLDIKMIEQNDLAPKKHNKSSFGFHDLKIHQPNKLKNLKT